MEKVCSKHKKMGNSNPLYHSDSTIKLPGDLQFLVYNAYIMIKVPSIFHPFHRTP